MKKLFLGVALSLVSVASFAQFEGVVEFTKNKGKINISYKYYVKGDNVRVEEIGKDGSLDGIMLIDLTKKEVLAISPDRKMYMEAPNRKPIVTADVDTKKTKETKTINGVKCTKYVVTSTAQDRKMEYWIADGEYDFFIPLLKTINRREKQSMYYLSMDGMDGKFPMLGKESTLKEGVAVSTLSATKVTKKKLDASLFAIPTGYKKFER